MAESLYDIQHGTVGIGGPSMVAVPFNLIISYLVLGIGEFLIQKPAVFYRNNGVIFAVYEQHRRKRNIL